MSKRLCTALLIFLSSTVHAQSASLPTAEAPLTDTTKNEIPTEPVLVTPARAGTTSMFRGLSRYTGNLHLSPLSTWVPLKYGVSAGYVFDEKWTAEAEVTHQSFAAGLLGLDFGRISDTRYGVQARLYPSNGSFNFILGLFRSELSFELGNSLISRIPGVPSTDVFKVRALGPELGLANRWQWQSGFTFGVDWFVIYYPLFDKQADDDIIKAVTNANDKDDLNGAVKFFRDKPQFDLLKLTFGYTF